MAPPTQGEAEHVFVEPPAVVEHVSQEVLLGTILAAEAGHSASPFASRINGQRKGHLVQQIRRNIVVLDLDTVIGMPARAVKTDRVLPDPILIADEGKPRCWTPQDLPANAHPAIEAGRCSVSISWGLVRR
jgi:hypothetical protein